MMAAGSEHRARDGCAVRYTGAAVWLGAAAGQRMRLHPGQLAARRRRCPEPRAGTGVEAAAAAPSFRRGAVPPLQCC
jgi:hypothetical protein